MRKLTIDVTGLRAVALCDLINSFGEVFGSLGSKLNATEAEFLFGNAEAANSVANTWVEASVPTEGNPLPQRAQVFETEDGDGIEIVTPGGVSIGFCVRGPRSERRIGIDFGTDNTKEALQLLELAYYWVTVEVDGQTTTAESAALTLRAKLVELSKTASAIEAAVNGVIATVVGESIVVNLDADGNRKRLRVLLEQPAEAGQHSRHPRDEVEPKGSSHRRANRARFRDDGDTVKSATNVAPE